MDNLNLKKKGHCCLSVFERGCFRVGKTANEKESSACLVVNLNLQEELNNFNHKSDPFHATWQRLIFPLIWSTLP